MCNFRQQQASGIYVGESTLYLHDKMQVDDIV